MRYEKPRVLLGLYAIAVTKSWIFSKPLGVCFDHISLLFRFTDGAYQADE
jgi:hypothetical protein